MEINKKNYESVQDLFTKTGRKERNEYFGTYLADSATIDLASLSQKVKSVKESYEGYLANLEILAVTIQKEQKEKEAQQLIASVGSLTPEQRKALKEALDKVESSGSAN